MNTFTTNQRLLQERLREAASFGDFETVQEILTMGVNVNAKNDVNGWTALHWAAYRNNPNIVNLLLTHGADKTSITAKGESPYDLTTVKEVQLLLEGVVMAKEQIKLPITPNYIANPPLQVNSSNSLTVKKSDYSDSKTLIFSEEELVLKLRVANSEETDFIEIELPKSDLSLSKLVEACCTELEISSSSILKIRKLPNTILRKDKDIQRLKDFQEIEVVLKDLNSSTETSTSIKSNPLSAQVNGNQYESISLKKDQTVLY